jgi:prepilin-type processing-associated H-X9-DG protein
MKARTVRAFTKIDLAIVVATVGMLAVWAGFLLPRMWPARPRASRINCVSNLKQIGLGFRMWSNDHGERFPWQVPAADGGTKEFAGIPIAALHFITVSKEFNSPKILTCTTDTNKFRTNGWEGPLQPNLSYFAGLNADETDPASILSGDRNVSTNSSMLAGLLTVENAEDVQWTKDIHQHAGNIGFADGSVQQSTSMGLRNVFKAAFEKATKKTICLVIP